MDGNQFLKLYQETLFEERFYDRLETIDGIQIASVDFDDSMWWNNATTLNNLSQESISLVEKYFAGIGRKPTYYFAEGKLGDELEKTLSSLGYEQGSYEVWLEMQNPHIDNEKFEQVREVKSQDEMNVFLRTIDAGYGANDPDNPYGGLGKYLDQLQNAFTARGDHAKIKHYVIFNDEGLAVGVGSLTSYEGIGYISNIATIPSARRHGYGSAILNYLLDLSVKKGNSIHCLATEIGEYPDRLYRKIGFTELFRAKYYVKK